MTCSVPAVMEAGRFCSPVSVRDRTMMAPTCPPMMAMADRPCEWSWYQYVPATWFTGTLL